MSPALTVSLGPRFYLTSSGYIFHLSKIKKTRKIKIKLTLADIDISNSTGYSTRVASISKAKAR